MKEAQSAEEISGVGEMVAWLGEEMSYLHPSVFI